MNAERRQSHSPSADMDHFLLHTKMGQKFLQHLAGVCLAMVSHTIEIPFISWANGPSEPGVFESTKENVSNMFPMEVTMDRWTRSVDLTFILGSSILQIFSMFLVFKCHDDFGLICCNPEVHPPRFYLFWPLFWASHIGGLLLWDRQMILPALFLRILPPVIGFYMLFMSYRNMERFRPWLYVISSKLAWFIYYMTQNNLAMLSCWFLIEALVNLGVVMKYTIGLQDPAASSVVLTLVFLIMLLWFVLETFVYVKYIHYTFTVYPTIVLGLGAMFTKGFQPDDMAPNTIYCGILMVVATVMNCIMLFRHCCDQRWPSASNIIVILPMDQLPVDGQPVAIDYLGLGEDTAISPAA